MTKAKDVPRDNCPFCNSGKRVIKENTLASVILSNPRKVAGHFLVIPKRHVEKPWELTDEEIAAIFKLVFLVQKKVTEKLSDGCDVRQNYRPFLKQDRIKVDHVHYHIIPRGFEDKIYDKVEKYETNLFEDLSDEEYTEIAKLLED